MRGAVMYGKGDVRLEQLPEPAIVEPTDAVVRNAASCVCWCWNIYVARTMLRPRPNRILN